MDVHLFALEQLFCSMCALCSSEMKVSGLSNMNFTYRTGDVKTLKLWPSWLDCVDAGHQHVLKGTPANADLVAAAVVVIVVFEAQLVSLKRLDFEFKIEVKQELIFIPDPLSCRQNGLFDDLFWLLLQN